MYKFGINFESRSKRAIDGLNGRKGRGRSKKKTTYTFLSGSLNGEWITNMRTWAWIKSRKMSLVHLSRQPLKCHPKISKV